jgi:hypothetical protein
MLTRPTDLAMPFLGDPPVSSERENRKRASVGDVSALKSIALKSMEQQ